MLAFPVAAYGVVAHLLGQIWDVRQASFLIVSVVIGYALAVGTHEFGHAFVAGLVGARDIRFGLRKGRFLLSPHVTSVLPLRDDFAAVMVYSAGAVAVMLLFDALGASLLFHQHSFPWIAADGVAISCCVSLCQLLTFAEGSDISHIATIVSRTVVREVALGAPILQLSAAAISRGSTSVLVNVEFEVVTGRIIGIVGPNGVGKSTLLEALAGTLAFDGTRAVARNVRCAYAPQHAATLRPATFGANLTYFSMMTDCARDAALERALGLTNLMEKVVADASGGEIQRLSIAVALQQYADVIILDEPESGLDPAARAVLRDVLRSRAAMGAAVVVSSHFVKDILGYCDLIVHLADGKLQHLEASEAAALRLVDVGRMTAVLTRRELSKLDGISYFIESQTADEVTVIIQGDMTYLDSIEHERQVAFRSVSLEASA
jgi:ABC-2 type transport system ATP-binding protein